MAAESGIGWMQEMAWSQAHQAARLSDGRVLE